MIKRILAVLLAVLTVVCFASCKKDADNTKTSGVSSNGIDEYTSDLDVEDLEGYQFRMLVRPAPSFPDQYVQEDSDDPI